MSRVLLSASLVLAVAGGAVFVAGQIFALPDAAQFFYRAALPAGLLGAVLIWAARRLSGASRADALLLNLVLAAAVSLGGLVLSEYALRYAFRDVTTTADLRSYFAVKWLRATRWNQHGFREREIRTEKGAGVRRIAVIGDSITFGQGVKEEERFSNILESRLNAAAGGGRRYEVLNFGRLGAETEDHLATLREVVLGLSPDFVLLQWYTNDVEGRDKSGRPRPWPLLPSDFLTGRLREHSVLYYLLDRQWASLQRAAGWMGSYEGYMVDRFGDPEGVGARTAEEHLQSIIRLCANANVGLEIVLFPDLRGDAGLGFLRERVLDQCGREGIPCLDLSGVFAPRAGGQGLWASRLDPHPGPVAHRIAAERLMEVFGPLWMARAGASQGGAGGVAGDPRLRFSSSLSQSGGAGPSEGS